MKLIIDGTDYEMDGDFFVEQWYRTSAPYINPDTPEGKKYTDLRLAAKAALRLRLSAILKLFAGIFEVADWRTLQPGRGEDMLVKLHQYMTVLLRAEAQNLVLEMETVNARQGTLDTHARPRLALVRASFHNGQTIYERPDTGGQVTNGTGPRAALSASTSGGGLVPDADDTAF